jgi:hypothetical protein
VDTEEAEEGREETMVVEVETEDEVAEAEAGEGVEEEVLEG